MGGPILVFSLLLMAFVARGLPTTKETISRKSQIEEEGPPTIEASRWPSLAEVITKAGNGIKPSASLLDILNSEPNTVVTRKIPTNLGVYPTVTRKIRNSLPTTLSTTTVLDEIPATVFDVADFGITDIGWNEDNIKLDFITGRAIYFKRFQKLILYEF